MRHVLRAAALIGLVVGAAQVASAQSATFNYETGTDQGWGTGFGDDASANWTVSSVGGSQRMLVPNTDGFQEAGFGTGNTSDPFFLAMAAAAANPAGYKLSYDWYVDASQVSNATFLQLGSFVNAGNGFYSQNFPATGKEVELNGTQLTSGQVLSGHVDVPFTTYVDGTNATLPTGQTFYRIGLIENAGAGAVIPVYFDNVSVAPVPEPASLALLGLGVPALALRRRRKTA